MAPQLLNGERRSVPVHFTLHLTLFMAIREKVTVHEVAGFVRRAIAAAEYVHVGARVGNRCSFVFRVTPQMSEQIERERRKLGCTASAYIEACCWELIAREVSKGNPHCSP